MENKHTIREYNEAVRRILKREGLKLQKAKSPIGLDEATKNFRERLNEVSDKILNGEMDTEIENEIELIRKEQRAREER